MAANPPLLRAFDNSLVPTPYAMEAIALQRGGVEFWVDGVQTRSGKWSTKGVLYLTNMRLVFVANETHAESGLAAFELPLVYVKDDKFNQPIFGCNNLSGKVWPAVPGGGSAGQLPPHSFVIYFKEGGVGTFLPLYFRFLEYLRALNQRAGNGDAAAAGNAPAPSAPAAPQSVAAPQQMLSTAFVDPNDPTKVFLTSPVPNSQHLKTTPQYAPNFQETQHEQYEDMGLRP